MNTTLKIGRLIKNTDKLRIDDFSIKPIADGDTEKQLGIEKNISYVGLTIKKTVTKEPITRVNKISKSELSSFTKISGHNTLSIPFLTSVRIIN